MTTTKKSTKKAPAKKRAVKKVVPEYLTDHDRLIKLLAEAGFRVTSIHQSVQLSEFVPLQSGNGLVPLRNLEVHITHENGVTEIIQLDAYLLGYNLAMWEAAGGIQAAPEACEAWAAANPLPDRLKALYDPAEDPEAPQEDEVVGAA